MCTPNAPQAPATDKRRGRPTRPGDGGYFVRGDAQYFDHPGQGGFADALGGSHETRFAKGEGSERFKALVARLPEVLRIAGNQSAQVSDKSAINVTTLRKRRKQDIPRLQIGRKTDR